MSATYHYKKGMMALGPYPLERMRDLVRQAEIGRAHRVSVDGGASWRSAEECPELFQYEEPLLSPPPTPDSRDQVPEPPPDDAADGGTKKETGPESEEPRPRRKRKRRPQQTPASNTYAISGFICSLVAALLLAVPCLVWVLIAQSFFWIFNTVVPLGILASLGLAFSTMGLRKAKTGLATAGSVLGVIALAMTVMAVVGSCTIRYRMATLRRGQIDGWVADIELNRKDLSESLASFRNLQQEPEESEEQFHIREMFHLKAAAAHLRDLAMTHQGLLTATASTSEFREAFEEEVPLLRKSILEVQRLAESKNLSLQELLPSVNADTDALKLLLDTLSLYEKGRLTLRQIEGKMTGK